MDPASARDCYRTANRERSRVVRADGELKDLSENVLGGGIVTIDRSGDRSKVSSYPRHRNLLKIFFSNYSVTYCIYGVRGLRVK